MGIFDEIAAAIGGDTAIEIPSNCRQANITTKLGPSTTEKDFIEWSAEHPNKKTNPEDPGNSKDNKENYYWSGTATNNHLVSEDMEKSNRNWAEDDLKGLGSECFTYLFRRKLWPAIKQTAASQVTSPIYDPEELFYFFAFALQRLVDPKHKKLGWGSDTFDPADFVSHNPESADDRLIYEPFRLMIPDVFDGYIPEGSGNGTYAGFYGLGNTSITIEDQSSGDLTTVLSRYQFDEEENIESWYDLFNNPSFSEDPSTLDGLLGDELKSLKSIQDLFTLDMIYALKKDIEDNGEAYKLYESVYIQSTHFSLENLGPGVWHIDPNRSNPPDNLGAGMAYLYAEKFWNDFIELYLIASGDLAAIEDLERESIEQADLFSFDPDQCGIPETIKIYALLFVFQKIVSL